jgi:hypothetical protein
LAAVSIACAKVFRELLGLASGAARPRFNRRAIESEAELRVVWYISSPQRHGEKTKEK